MEEEEKIKEQQPKISLKQIMGGDLLNTELFRRQIKLLVLIMACTILYIGNRYDSQRDMITIEELRKELIDIQYQALNTTSNVSAKSKPSYIESVVREDGLGLKISADPPFLLPD
ncbi:MAG TPA: FtsL-like putative cell division protein [Bacteroidaceae bacterium]|nr:FtsL-like putative cell division protein [Bacteroidaceae bacterium]